MIMRREGQRTGSGDPRRKSAVDPGADLERRIARLEFAEGALARVRVPVRVAADPGRSILTDLDVLALDVDNRLRLTRSIVECKSGKGQSGEPDRLLWLSGLQRFLAADRALLVRQTITKRGRAIASELGLHILDMATLTQREAAYAWLPERFAHVDGPACTAAESRADVHLKALGYIPGSLVAFLRHDVLSAESHRCLNALHALKKATSDGGVLPQPTARILAGHALITLLLAAIRDAASLDTVPVDELKIRVERSLTLGSPDDDQSLAVLSSADGVMRLLVERVHASYTAAGAHRLDVPLPSLRDLVSDAPAWIDRYVDLVAKVRANPTVAKDLPRTAELACFDAMLGDVAYQQPAFNHLFTPEHRYLLVVAVRCLAEIAGEQIAANIQDVLSLDFSRSAPAAPDRTLPVEGEMPDFAGKPSVASAVHPTLDLDRRV